MDLLDKVLELIKEKGYKVKSLSAVIMAEKPKLLKHIPTITKNLATAINIDTDSIGIGATTLEGLGFVGREEGICVHANAILEKI
jgi:2-C-methyl-D-erythritol 2,4-cyclodiphosphate synthase